ncbi:MAG: tetratricopeptide repeat protein [Polyangia bacterium]
MRLFRRLRLTPVLPGGLIVVLILLAYLPVLQAGFIWDDDSWTTKLVGVFRDSAGLRSIWFQPTAMQQYYPLTGTTFWLDYQLWRFWAPPYHVENVLLHATAALLFWRVLRRLRVPGAWLASALFALHPVNVESVGWITERKNVLSLALCLGALLAYLRFEEQRPAPADRWRRWYVLAWVLFLAALLAKTAVCSLPAAILLLAWWRRGKVGWRADVLPTLPFFAIGLCMCAVTAWLEKNHLAAQGADYALTLSQRCLIAGRAFWFYLGQLIWPAHLCFIYPRWQPDARAWTQWLYPMAAVVFVLTLWLARRRIGRGPLAALFFFAGSLSPLLGFTNVYFMRFSFVADHWVYWPSLGPIALAAAGISVLLDRCGGTRVVRPAVIGALLLIFVILTPEHAAAYADVETLWRTAIRCNSGSWFAHSNLGYALARKGKIDDATREFREAIRLKPDVPETCTGLGVVLGLRGQIDEAIGWFREAIRLRPTYPDAHYDLGIALSRKGQSDGAIREFEEAIRLMPGFSAARQSLRTELGRKANREHAAEPLPQR